MSTGRQDRPGRARRGGFADRSSVDRTRLIAVAVTAIFLSAAVVSDVARRRIPNVISVSMALAGLGFALWRGGPKALGLPALAMAAAVIVLLPLFAKGGLGAGDVKLFGASATWLGFPHVLWGALYTGVAGGLLALVYLPIAGARARKDVKDAVVALALTRSLPEVDKEAIRRDPKRGLPYGVAIAAGTLAALLLHPF